MATAPPSFPERKGTLLLRSDHLEFSLNRTSVTGWHQAREAEPRDFVVEDHVENQDLHRSTYHRLGADDVTDVATTTTKVAMEERHQLPDYTERQVGPSMVNQDNFHHTVFDRSIGKKGGTSGDVLPHHQSGYNKHHLHTTYSLNFQPPDGYDESKALTWEKVKEIEEPHDYSAHRHRRSQFSDTDGCKQTGQWRDSA